MEAKYGREAMEDDRIASDFGEEHSRSNDVRRAMCSVLIVAIWADMEQGLKLVCKCVHLQNRSRKDGEWPTLTWRFRDTGEWLRSGKETLLKKLRQIVCRCMRRHDANRDDKKWPKLPWEFGGIEGWLKREAKTSLKTLKHYDIVNAIRVLNNCVKHCDGHYRPARKAHTKIKPELCEQWGITPDCRIEFERISIPEVLKACHSFCADLLQRTKINEKDV